MKKIFFLLILFLFSCSRYDVEKEIKFHRHGYGYCSVEIVIRYDSNPYWVDYSREIIFMEDYVILNEKDYCEVTKKIEEDVCKIIKQHERLIKIQCSEESK